MITFGRVPDARKEDVDDILDLRGGARRGGPGYRVGADTQYTRLPIPGHRNRIDPRRLERAARILRDADEGGRRLYVHCLHGINRTGCVVITWLVRYKNMVFGDALRYFCDMRRERPREGLLDWLRRYLAGERRRVTRHGAGSTWRRSP